ncbi:MAG TPA: helix-turn-helix transcriptional regulator [Saccharofermentans sp.]|nr:helix-turn-helix transcriptional regulator [Saccharofermentans sp.]
MEKHILIRFGLRVKELRHSLGISQEELAEKAGVHRTYIGMIERGEKNITLKSLSKIAVALGINTSYLLEGID